MDTTNGDQWIRPRTSSPLYLHPSSVLLLATDYFLYRDPRTSERKWGWKLCQDGWEKAVRPLLPLGKTVLQLSLFDVVGKRACWVQLFDGKGTAHPGTLPRLIHNTKQHESSYTLLRRNGEAHCGYITSKPKKSIDETVGSRQGWWEWSCAGREVSLGAGNQWLGVTCGRTMTWKIKPDCWKSRQKEQHSAKDSQRDVFVMWSFERLEWSTAWEWGIEIAKKLYPATFSPNVFVEHVFSFIFVTERDHISESPGSAIYFS